MKKENKEVEVPRVDKQNEFVDVINCRQDWQIKEYLKILERGVDPFGSREEIERLGNTIVCETDHFWVITNKYYKGPKHYLVGISKIFVTSIFDLPQLAILEAVEIVNVMKKRYKIKGGGFFTRFDNTRISGASVKRAHFNIVEPKKGQLIPMWLGSKIEKKVKPIKKKK